MILRDSGEGEALVCDECPAYNPDGLKAGATGEAYEMDEKRAVGLAMLESIARGAAEDVGGASVRDPKWAVSSCGAGRFLGMAEMG